MEYNKADEFDTIKFDGEEFKIKWYYGYLFATEELADVLLDNNGEYISDEAGKLDERIGYYFLDEDFDGKTGEQLYNEMNKI